MFALGPIGLCAVAGARLKGATTIIGVDAVAARMSVAGRLGATHVVNFKDGNAVEQIMALTGLVDTISFAQLLERQPFARRTLISIRSDRTNQARNY